MFISLLLDLIISKTTSRATLISTDQHWSTLIFSTSNTRATLIRKKSKGSDEDRHPDVADIWRGSEMLQRYFRELSNLACLVVCLFICCVTHQRPWWRRRKHCCIWDFNECLFMFVFVFVFVFVSRANWSKKKVAYQRPWWRRRTHWLVCWTQKHSWLISETRIWEKLIYQEKKINVKHNLNLS